MQNILEESKKRNPSQKRIMVEMLRKAGKLGVTNIEFSRVANCYGARLSELYNVGYEISTEYVADGVYKYILDYEPDHPKQAPKKIDELVGAINKEFGGEVTLDELESLIARLDINVRRKSFPNLK